MFFIIFIYLVSRADITHILSSGATGAAGHKEVQTTDSSGWNLKEIRFHVSLLGQRPPLQHYLLCCVFVYCSHISFWGQTLLKVEVGLLSHFEMFFACDVLVMLNCVHENCGKSIIFPKGFVARTQGHLTLAVLAIRIPKFKANEYKAGKTVIIPVQNSPGALPWSCLTVACCSGNTSWFIFFYFVVSVTVVSKADFSSSWQNMTGYNK